MNKVILFGNVGADAMVYTGKNGDQVTKFALATHERYKAGEETKTTTTWHNVVVFGKYGILISEMAKKGKECLVSGKINVQQWEDQGVKKQTFQIIADSVRVVKNE